MFNHPAHRTEPPPGPVVADAVDVDLAAIALENRIEVLGVSDREYRKVVVTISDAGVAPVDDAGDGVVLRDEDVSSLKVAVDEHVGLRGVQGGPSPIEVSGYDSLLHYALRQEPLLKPVEILKEVAAGGRQARRDRMRVEQTCDRTCRNPCIVRLRRWRPKKGERLALHLGEREYVRMASPVPQQSRRRHRSALERGDLPLSPVAVGVHLDEYITKPNHGSLSMREHDLCAHVSIMVEAVAGPQHAAPDSTCCS